MSMKYTAQEMRETADFYARNAEQIRNMVHSNAILANIHETIAMLRQAADILDGIRKEIDIIEKMPTANLDGSFEAQTVNGKRVIAKIAFYKKINEIVGEEVCK